MQRPEQLSPHRTAGPVPAKAGIGLKPEHYAALLSGRPALGFLEVHTENYMGEGGPPHRYLEALRDIYPLSFHGVGMSLGGVTPLDRDHLRRWRHLVDRYQPALVSEHVAWSAFEDAAFHDLLPIPYSQESLDHLCAHIDQMQEALGRSILIENPSAYIAARQTHMAEPDFLVEACRRTGCGLLLDVNNVYVSAANLGLDPLDWIDHIPGDLIHEIHLAGHSVETIEGLELRIDDHGSPVIEAVWDLYRRLTARIGRRPSLIEWDTDVPALDTLLAEAARADEAAMAALSREVDYARIA